MSIDIGRKGIAGIILLVILIIGVVTVATSIVTIQSGSRGVLLQWGKVTGILGDGIHIKMPFRDSVVIMNTQNQKAEAVEESCATSDIQEVLVDITINYKIIETSVDTIYADLRKDYEMRVVVPNIKESIKGVSTDFTAEELLLKRESVKSAFKSTLAERLLPYNIVVIDVQITNYRFNQGFLDAVNDKVIALQEAQKALNDLERIRWEAQQQIIQAEAQANATIATATASATAQIIEAEANAEAIRLVQEQLTANPEYIQYLTVTGWDGVLPYFLGSDVMPFFQLNTTD